MEVKSYTVQAIEISVNNIILLRNYLPLSPMLQLQIYDLTKSSK